MSLITFVLDSTSGIIEVPNRKIHEQVLTLVSYKFKFDTDANAKLASLITFNAPFVNGTVSDFYKNSDSTNVTLRQGLPLLVDGISGSFQTCSYSFDMVQAIASNFEYTLIGDSVAGFESLILVFSYVEHS